MYPPPDKLADQKKQILQDLIKDYELQEAWVEELLHLVQEKYPSLEERGSQPMLLEDVKRVIENAVTQQEIADAEA